jgi:MFS transporter, ACS family, allantoate permease
MMINLPQLTINAMTLFSFSVGNIVGTEIFLPADAPSYIPGKTAIIVLMTVQLFVCFGLRAINVYKNKMKAKRLAEEKDRRGWSDADVQRERERHAFLDLTDKQ